MPSVYRQSRSPAVRLDDALFVIGGWFDAEKQPTAFQWLHAICSCHEMQRRRMAGRGERHSPLHTVIESVERGDEPFLGQFLQPLIHAAKDGGGRSRLPAGFGERDPGHDRHHRGRQAVAAGVGDQHAEMPTVGLGEIVVIAAERVERPKVDRPGQFGPIRRQLGSSKRFIEPSGHLQALPGEPCRAPLPSDRDVPPETPSAAGPTRCRSPARPPRPAGAGRATVRAVRPLAPSRYPARRYAGRESSIGRPATAASPAAHPVRSATGRAR